MEKGDLVEMHINNGEEDCQEGEESLIERHIRSRFESDGLLQFHAFVGVQYERVKRILEEHPFLTITKFNFSVSVLKEAEDIHVQLSTSNRIYDPLTNDSLIFPFIEMGFLEFEQQAMKGDLFDLKGNLVPPECYLMNVFLEWNKKQEKVVSKYINKLEHPENDDSDEEVEVREKVTVYKKRFTKKGLRYKRKLQQMMTSSDDYRDMEEAITDLELNGSIREVPVEEDRVFITKIREPLSISYKDSYVSIPNSCMCEFNYLKAFNETNGSLIAFDLLSINIYKRRPMIFCPANGYCFLLYDIRRKMFKLADTYPLLIQFYNIRKDVLMGDKVHLPARTSDIIVKPEHWRPPSPDAPFDLLETDDRRLKDFYSIVDALLPDDYLCKTELILKIGELLIKDLKISGISVEADLQRRL